MSFFAICAMKDLRRLARDPLGLVLCIAMPLVITVLVSSIFGGENVTPRGKLLVVDEDDSFLSSAVRTAFGQGPLAKMVVIEVVKAEEGRSRIDRGDASALLVIPKDFQELVLQDKPCELKLITNPAQRIVPGIITESLGLLSEAEFYAQALAGDQFRKFVNRPPTDAEIAELSVMGRRLGEKLQRYIDPPLIKLQTQVVAEQKQASLGELFFPGMLFFGIIMVGQTLASDVWKEKSSHTLRRTLITPGRLSAFLLGKLASVAAVLAVVAVFGLLLGRFLLHISIGAPPLALVWIVGTGAVMYLLLVVVNLYAGGERGANVLTSMVVFPLAMVGGGMFPFEMMPEWLAAIGRWTPNGWASIEFKSILAGSAEMGQLGIAAGCLAAVAGAAFAIALQRLRRFSMS